MSAEMAQVDDSSELPHPNDNPTLAYAHEGKQYKVFSSDRVFEIVEYRADQMPAQDGVVIIESADGERINSEHKHRRGGVSRDAIAEHIPDSADRAAWTVAGLMSELSDLKIGEVDTRSYDDLYWNSLD